MAFVCEVVFCICIQPCVSILYVNIFNICVPPMFMWCMLRLLMWQDGGGLREGICIVFVFVLYFVVYALLGGGLRVGGATILS